MKIHQRGISFVGMLFVTVVIGCLLIVGAQVAPTLIEFQAITKAASKAAAASATVAEVRASFDKSAAVDDIKSMSGRDLEVTKVGEKIVVSFAYPREIHLVGPAFLLMKYAGSSK